MQRENGTLEFKQEATRSFLKTASAYANYNTGSIIFGVDDDGIVVGLEDVSDTCLRVENAMNDSLSPVPLYRLEPDYARGIVTLTVFEGSDKPYLCHGKAYRRNDSATYEVDALALRRLVLEGKGISYDSLDASTQDLMFDDLGRRLVPALGIQALSSDVMRTLELLSPDGNYANAAALLADSNEFPGIEVVRFGSTINEIRDRRSCVNASVLKQLDIALDMFEANYSYELIEGAQREKRHSIPPAAFREAVINALAHRTWDVPANVTVAMFDDRIEVVSPGGLPTGLTEAEYLEGFISMPRNPILVNVLFRMHYIERLGSGVMRIKEAYASLEVAPLFKISENAIKVILPVMRTVAMTPDESVVFAILAKGLSLSRSDIEMRSGFEKDKTLRILKALEEKGSVRRTGAGRASRYERA